MIRKLTCIECPKGCPLSVDVKGGRVLKVTGGKCPKGDEYAVTEIENPTRILTSTVLAEGLSLKMVPVRTDRPIPKADISRAMKEIKKIRIKAPLHIGDAVVTDFLNLGVNLVATRDRPD